MISEGDNGDFLFVIEKGALKCTKLVEGEEKVVKTVNEGDVFGELALLYNCPRAASVVANDVSWNRVYPNWRSSGLTDYMIITLYNIYFRQQQNGLGFNLSLQGVRGVAIDGPRLEPGSDVSQGGLAKKSLLILER